MSIVSVLYYLLKSGLSSVSDKNAKGKQNLLKTEQVRVKSFDKYGICSLISVYKQIADLIKDCILNADPLTSILFVYIPAKDQAI